MSWLLMLWHMMIMAHICIVSGYCSIRVRVIISGIELHPCGIGISRRCRSSISLSVVAIIKSWIILSSGCSSSGSRRAHVPNLPVFRFCKLLHQIIGVIRSTWKCWELVPILFPFFFYRFFIKAWILILKPYLIIFHFNRHILVWIIIMAR